MDDHKITDKEALKKKYLPLVVQQLQKGALPQSLKPKLEKLGFSNEEADDLINQAIAAAGPSPGAQSAAQRQQPPSPTQAQPPPAPAQPAPDQPAPVQVTVPAGADSGPAPDSEFIAKKEKLIAAGFSPYEAHKMAQAAVNETAKERLVKAGFSEVEAEKMAKARATLGVAASVGYARAATTLQVSSDPKMIIFHYAGFWERLVAALIDGAILFIPNVIVSVIFALPLFTSRQPGLGALLFSWLGFPVVAGMYWLYFAMMESGPHMATIGKAKLNLMVTDTGGDQISFVRASGRFFGKFLSFPMSLGIGYLIAGFTTEKRALHDYVAGTMVLKKF